MDFILDKIKNVNQDPCITIKLNTSRTKPDYLADPLALKNLVKEVDSRLKEMYDKRLVWKLMENIESVQKKIDFSHNLNSLLIFVNENFAEFVTLPVQVKQEVIIGNNFHTREVIKARSQSKEYYVLVLSHFQARLLHAREDNLVKEFSDEAGFTVNNLGQVNDYQVRVNIENESSGFIAELFNNTDKLFKEVYFKQPLPVVIASEESNYHKFKNVADMPENIIGHINKNRDDHKAPAVVKEAWKVVQEYVKKQQESYKVELEDAQNNNLLVSEISEIWRAINEGRGDLLMVEETLHQPAQIMENGFISISDSGNGGEIVDDVVDEIIEANMRMGGRICFLPSGSLEDFSGMVLKARYYPS